VQLVDRWFRAWGVLALVALAVTAAMLALRAEPWRVPFVAAHLAALVALLPLGVTLVASTYLRQLRMGQSALGAAGATLTYDRVATALTLLALATACVSLSQFAGNQTVRLVANLVTVSVVVVLVVRYVRSR
jgi:hypothetical protein